MTAVSPYAPTRRNSVLRRTTSSSSSTALRRRSSAAGGGGAVALMCVLLNFWDADLIRRVARTIRVDGALDRGSSVMRAVAESEIGAAVSRNGGATLARFVASLIRLLGVWTGRGTDGKEDGERGTEGDRDHAFDRSTDGGGAERTVASSAPPSSAVAAETETVDDVRRNRRSIDAVLAYWFGQHSPDGSQKQLWMIAASSVEHRNRVDAEIARRFGDLICALSDPKDDGALLHRWCNDKDLYGWHGKLAAIVVLDQMSRHVHRHRAESSSSSPADDGPEAGEPSLSQRNTLDQLPDQKVLDNLAYRTSRLFQTCHRREIDCGMVPLPMQVFALMPYRHAGTISTVGYVQEAIECMVRTEVEMDGMVRRFRKATNRRMAVLQDEARRTGRRVARMANGDGGDRDNVPAAADADAAAFAAEIERESAAKPFVREEGSFTTAASDLSGDEDERNERQPPENDADSSSVTKVFRDEDILETFPFDADMSGATSHVVIKTMRSFLSRISVCPDVSCRVPVVVSLSGGVDSMVIVSALAFLRDEDRYGLSIVAVHIDYANRPESSAEADYVRQYCDRLGVEYRCRRIDEVTRGITARDEYERVAREVRYETYRRTVEDCARSMKTTEGSEGDCSETEDGGGAERAKVGIMLGHHRGDLRENVLSNAHRGCGPLDLSGMTPISRNDGVTIYRPLLPLEKAAVYDYAHAFGVPYFKDTTPHWSTRGKLRNKLLPLLEEIYGEGSMTNLSTLAEESDEAKALLHKTVLQPFLDGVRRYPMGISFETAQWRQQGLFFWKLVLRDVLHSAGRGMFSDKSVASFLERVSAKKFRAGWLQCRRDYAVYLQENGQVFVLNPESFPFRKSDQYDCIGKVIGYGVDNAIEVGPWRIISEIVSAHSTNKSQAEDLLSQKAVSGFDQFMSGNIVYYLQTLLPCNDNDSQGGNSCLKPPRPLVVVSGFTRQSRPRSWKNFDLKIQSTLPLLGNDKTTTNEMSNGHLQNYGIDWCLVKVTLALKGSGCG